VCREKGEGVWRGGEGCLFVCVDVYVCVCVCLSVYAGLGSIGGASVCKIVTLTLTHRNTPQHTATHYYGIGGASVGRIWSKVGSVVHIVVS